MIWVVRFIGWSKIESAFLLFTGWQGMIILLLTALFLFFGMWRWKLILKSQGYDLSNKKLVGPFLSGYSLIYLFPVLIFGGEIFRSYILKEKYSVPWKNSITSVIIDKILDVTASLAVIFAGAAFFLLKIGLPPRNLGIILGGILILFTVSIGFFYFKSLRRESMVRFFTKFFSRKKLPNGEVLEAEKELFKFFKNKGAVWQGFGLSFLRVAVIWLRCWLLILFLGKSIGAFPALSILGFYYLALMIPIPASLGSHEIIQTFSFNALGLGASLAPAFTMIQRGAELILVFVGLMIFFRLGMGLLKTILFKKIDVLMETDKDNQA